MSHQYGGIRRLLGTVAGASTVIAVLASAAWAAATFKVSSQRVTPRAVVNVHSVTSCPAPAGAGDWIAIVKFGQGANPEIRYQDYTVAPDGSWSGTFTTPSQVHAGSAQLTASCFDAEHTSSTRVDYTPVSMTVVWPTTTTVICRPLSLHVGQSTKCTVTVTNNTSNGAPPPSGKAKFTASGHGKFNHARCTLMQVSASRSHCQVSYKPSSTGTHHITVVYPGDGAHAGGSSFVNVRASR